MKKIILTSVIIILFSLSNNLIAQIRMGNCGSQSDKNTIYLTFYGGYGFGKYRMDHNLIEKIIEENLRHSQLGASLHFKMNNSNIGFGADYNSFTNDLLDFNEYNYKSSIINTYLNFEYNLYSGHFYDFGFSLGLGYLWPLNIYDNKDMKGIPFNFHTSLFTNFVINSYSAIVVRVGYNLYNYENSIAKHQLSSTMLQAGFRMWFNY